MTASICRSNTAVARTIVLPVGFSDFTNLKIASNHAECCVADNIASTTWLFCKQCAVEVGCVCTRDRGCHLSAACTFRANKCRNKTPSWCSAICAASNWRRDDPGISWRVVAITSRKRKASWEPCCKYLSACTRC